MPFDPGVPPKWVRWLWEVDATEAAEEWEGGKGLGIGKIVRAGIALADDEGLEGVSVRKLAQRLSVSAMAAYRHISSRDEVIAAMVDVAFGRVLCCLYMGLRRRSMALDEGING